MIICSTCAAPGAAPQGAQFAKALRERVPTGVTIETTPCMNLCARPVSLALSAQGRDVYLFADVDPQMDLEDAVALARVYVEAEAGTIMDARPAGRLRHCLVGRVPAQASSDLRQK